MKLAIFVVILGLLTGSMDVTTAHALTAEETLAKVEKDFAQMQITKDPKAIAAVADIMADDFYFYDPTSGVRATKQQLIDSVKLPTNVTTSMTFPAFFVKVFGDTAVVQGTNQSTGHYMSQDTGGAYAWFDVFEKRDGHWVWLVSSSSKVDDKITDKVLCAKAVCTAGTMQPGFSLKP